MVSQVFGGLSFCVCVQSTWIQSFLLFTQLEKCVFLLFSLLTVRLVVRWRKRNCVRWITFGKFKHSRFKQKQRFFGWSHLWWLLFIVVSVMSSFLGWSTFLFSFNKLFFTWTIYSFILSITTQTHHLYLIITHTHTKSKIDSIVRSSSNSFTSIFFNHFHVFNYISYSIITTSSEGSNTWTKWMSRFEETKMCKSGTKRQNKSSNF